ncbi:MAG TPA: DNA cytosine methyltransferase [Solirubrobacterales bacterium]|nr:DNA cytosine methyltransferase [Solirubrobacterales bacterium]
MSAVTAKSASVDDLAFLRGPRPKPDPRYSGPPIGVVDLFAGCGAMTIGAIEGARRAGVSAELQLAVDLSIPGLEVVEATLETEAERVAALDLTYLLDEGRDETKVVTERIAQQGRGAQLLLAGPPCQGHSALNNHTRHDDVRNDLYLAVAEVSDLLKPAAVIVENVRGVGRDRRQAVDRCAIALVSQGYEVEEETLDVFDLGAPQRRIRHVLVATTKKGFDFDAMPRRPGRSVTWAIADLDGIDGNTLFDTSSVPTTENENRMNWLIEENAFDLPNDRRPRCHHDNHSYRSMYGRLRWDQPAQTVTSGFGSMGQGRFVHPNSPRTLTPHEAARLQFLPDYMDFSGVEQRGHLATMIGNAVPPVLMISIVSSLIEQRLL